MDERSKHLRRLVVRALEGGNRGHVGASMSLIEIMRVLYDDIAEPESRIDGKRYGDTIILSKGHGCLAQYVLLADKGVIELEELDRFCRFDGLLGGHPSRDIPGVVASTGALGHGLAIGVGIALARRNSRVFVVLGDGELGEGSVWEAVLHAAKHRLTNLTAIIDGNRLQSAGGTEQIAGRSVWGPVFYGFGWEYRWCDGHDIEQLKGSMSRRSYQPLAIYADTIKGYGIPFSENNLAWHHRNSFTAKEIAAMKEALQ